MIRIRMLLISLCAGALACEGSSSGGDDGTASGAGTGGTTSGAGDAGTTGDAGTSTGATSTGDVTTGGSTSTGSGATTSSVPPPDECGDPYFYDALCGDCQTGGMCSDGSPCFQTMYDGAVWGGCAPQCGGLTECPEAPSTGTAMAVCRPDPNFEAVCVLQCTTPGEQAECPDDMTCVEARTPDYGMICAFPP